MPGQVKETRLETVERQDKYPKDQLLRRYGKLYKVTRIVPEMQNGRPTGYYTVLGVEVRIRT